MFSLTAKRALVVGVANEHSIAWGCAKAFRQQGCDLAITYLNDKAERFVRPLAEEVGASIILPLDVQDDCQMEHVFGRIREDWGGLDVLLHSIAFCPIEDLHQRVIDCSRDGFSKAMDISVHSFLRMIRHSEPLMANGGTCITVSYYGAQKVVEHYNAMGPVKAALEAATRYAAAELGVKGISVHALSPGPIETRAASGIDQFQDLMERAKTQSPMGQTVSLETIGAYAAFLASAEASTITGGVHMIDGGYSIMG